MSRARSQNAPLLLKAFFHFPIATTPIWSTPTGLLKFLYILYLLAKFGQKTLVPSDGNRADQRRISQSPTPIPEPSTRPRIRPDLRRRYSLVLHLRPTWGTEIPAEIRGSEF